MDFTTPGTLRLTCAHGQADLLREEVLSLGLVPQHGDATGVECEGSMQDAMRLNLTSRISLRVLYRLANFECDHPDTLFEQAQAFPWETVVAPDGYVTITSTVRHPSIDNTMFANLRLKDALVDRVRSVHGRRPDTGPRRSGVVVHLHWHNDQAIIWLDTSGEKLSDRGYRKMPHRAPLRETLAAAILHRMGYDGSGPIVIPMCGSGTLAIEAALIATGRPPGLLRSAFAFQQVLGFDPEAWASIRRSVTPKKPRKGWPPTPPIVASDIDPAAMAATRRNAETAGVGHLLELHTCDFADTPMPSEPGHVVLHPEYGVRLGDAADLRTTYARIGDFLKQQCGGWSGWVFTGNLELAKSIGLRTACRVPMRHADLDARLLGYELWSGSRENRSADSGAST